MSIRNNNKTIQRVEVEKIRVVDGGEVTKYLIKEEDLVAFLQTFAEKMFRDTPKEVHSEVIVIPEKVNVKELNYIQEDVPKYNLVPTPVKMPVLDEDALLRKVQTTMETVIAKLDIREMVKELLKEGIEEAIDVADLKKVVVTEVPKTYIVPDELKVSAEEFLGKFVQFPEKPFVIDPLKYVEIMHRRIRT